MSKKLTWGIIGSGWIADVVSSDLKLSGFEIGGVYSRNPEKANKLATKYQVDHVYSSLADLLANPKVDVIYIATLNHLHKDMAIAALNAGKNVLCEKPLALNQKEAAEMVSAAKSQKLFFMEAMWSRFLPMYQDILRILNSGQIGNVLKILAEFSESPIRENKQRLWNLAEGGGALLDLGIYPISLTCMILGIPKPSEVHANATLADTKVDESTSISFQYENGNQALLSASIVTPGPATMSILGSDGRIEIEKLYTDCNFRVFNRNGDLISTHSPIEYSNSAMSGRQFQLLEVERCLNEGLLESPKMSWNDSIEIMGVMDQIRKQIGVTYPTD